MNELLLFYITTSATQVLPVIFIKLFLICGIPMPSFRNMLRSQLKANVELRNIGTLRFEQLFRLFDSDTIIYTARLSLISCFLEFAIVVFIALAIQYDLPLPYITNLVEWLYRTARSELLIFSIRTALIQLMPMIFFFSAFFFDLPFPFMPKPPENPAPSSCEILRWERDTEDIATIRLTRFKTSEKSFIFVDCRHDRLATGFKFVLCQGKERDAWTECYLYDGNQPHLEKINPAPVAVSELEKIFNASPANHDEV